MYKELKIYWKVWSKFPKCFWGSPPATLHDISGQGYSPQSPGPVDSSSTWDLISRLVLPWHFQPAHIWHSGQINLTSGLALALLESWIVSCIYRGKRYDTRVLSQLDRWSSTINIESFDFIDSTLAFGINTFVSFGLEI